MANNGRNYEQFVRALQQALLDSEQFFNQKNIKIESNKKIVDNCGIEREFDLYWEYELAGFVYKTVIECKDYESKVSIEKIDALIGKTHDLPDLKAIFATKTGYQSGAKKKADLNKIDLLVVREQTDSDWTDKNGNPLIREININLQIVQPAKTLGFSPILDGDWIKENTDINIEDKSKKSMRNDRITIDDIDGDKKYTLLQLEERLGAEYRGKSGEFTLNQNFSNAFICYDEQRLKLHSFTHRFFISPPLNMPINIDYSKELIGVIEYLDKDEKTVIFSDRIVKNWHK